jgi:tripartite-type tricarboxylate transporter receptor subunit TctC
MKHSRRRFLRLSVGVAAASSFSRVAVAQTYPMQPLRWVVGFPPGGGADIVSRIMAVWLSERLGQPVVIENKSGASTNLSIQAVVNSPADGYTLLFVAASAAVNMTLFKNLTFNLQRDIAPVSGLVDFSLVMIAHPSLPTKTVSELIAHAKTNPGKISIGSFGTGSTSHVAGELFKTLAGVNMVHVPYRGGAPMIADLIGGQIQVAFDVMTGAMPHIRSGAVRALGLGGKTRSEVLPDVPTIGETVPGYEANSWCGIGVPTGTSPEIIARLNREINAGLSDPTVKARFAQLAATPIFFTPAEFGTYVAAEVEKWGKVVKLSGVKPE